MIRTIFNTTAAAAVLIAGATSGFAMQKIADVDVTMDATAIENVEAAKFWSTIEGDLEEAIVTLVTDRMDDEGYNIIVKLDEVALATSFQGALGVESYLAGDVNVTNSQEPSETKFYNLSITALQDGMIYGEGETFSMVQSEAYYEALVKKFAESVVERLN